MDGFSATLPQPERRLARRLEGFGDIVFGFAVSQCALQLPRRGNTVELGHPRDLLLYFVTFALLASLWLTYHRMMNGAFRPTRIDMFLAFSFLAFVSLIPFGMYAIGHTGGDSLAEARTAIASYSGLYAVMSAIAAVISARNLARGRSHCTAEECDGMWVGEVRGAALFTCMSAACAGDLAFGPAWSSIAFFLIFPVVALTRRRFPHAPPSAGLRAVLAANRRAASPSRR
jgi:uncharacterized membrane protein